MTNLHLLPPETSGSGQSLPKWDVRAMSAFPLLATEERTSPNVSKVPGTEVATTFMSHMHYRWPQCVGDQSRSIRQELIVGAGAYPTPTGFLRVVCVEFGHHIELGVTFRRCVSSKPAHLLVQLAWPESTSS